MKVNELRIGNLVHAYKTIWSIDATDFSDGGGEDSKISTYNPIPLTEEWLLKFGYLQHPSTYEEAHTIDYTNGLSYIDMADQNITFRGIGKVDFNRIKYVHSFQNLYFALTGQELTIK